VNVPRILGAIVAILVSAPLQAGSASAEMHVGVQVIARAIVTVDGQQSIEITPADVSRGYVDATSPIVVRGRTNSRRGYMLAVEKTSDEFSAVKLEFPDASMSIGSHEVWIERPYVRGGEVVPVTVSLFLAPGITAGRHPMPISFNASPL
jgi:hypothetical protein